MSGSQPVLEISRKEARKIVIHAAGLAKKSPFGFGKDGAHEVIRHLGYVQIDTISVVARAHHHIISTRLPTYKNSWLLELQEEGKVFEYWAHAAAYLPIEDFRFSMPQKERHRIKNLERTQEERAEMLRVLRRIKEEGPLRARDFDKGGMKKSDGWWDWKPAKRALERLFFEGSLVIRSRAGFQKVYDLPENVIPSEINVTAPSPDEFAAYLIRRAIQSHGLVSIDEIVYLRKQIKGVVLRNLQKMIDAQEVTPVRIEGLDKVYYGLTPLIENRYRVYPRMHILSPFDNFTIQRRRLADLFEFSYQIECYVPEPKRKYGYFCLPVIYGTDFVGRLDLKADRRHGVLVIKNIFLEPASRTVPDEIWLEAIRRFAKLNKCDELRFLNPERNALSKRLLIGNSQT